MINDVEGAAHQTLGRCTAVSFVMELTLFFKKIISWGEVWPFCSWSCRSWGAMSAS